MPRFLRVVSSGAVPLLHGGRALQDLTYVSNAADAIHLAPTRPLPTPRCTYNVSNGTPLPFSDLLEMVAAALTLPLRTRHVPWLLAKTLATLAEGTARLARGPEPLLTRYGTGVLGCSQTLDISAISSELGYLPKTSIVEGLHLHAEWWRASRSAPASGNSP